LIEETKEGFMRSALFLFIFLLLSFNSKAFEWLPEANNSSIEVVNHFSMSVGFSHDYKLPQWVAYSLRAEHLRDCVQRSRFRFDFDPKLSVLSSDPNEFRYSGFDRGHLAPAGDMKWSHTAMRESFYTSNITAQTPSMNRGRWAMLEKLVRAWAKESDEILIVTGPVISDDMEYLQNASTAIPKQHYKVLLRRKNHTLDGIGFLMNQSPAGIDIKTMALSISKIEELTGLNFFPNLNEQQVSTIEKNLNLSDWDFKARFSYDRCLN
jgi:endonuclease G, mitochondrial